MRPTCERCGVQVSPTAPGTFQFASGWLEARKGGGAHAIALAVREQRFMCSPCVDLLRLGGAAQQVSLFD
jgi:hypothetical protein